MQRRNLYRFLVLLLIFTLILSACSKSSNPSASESNQPESTTSPEATQVLDPLAKYDPPIDFTIVGQSDPNLKFDDGQTYDKNSVYDAYAEELGINIKNNWMVDSAQYDEKVNLSIASGGIPDLMKVNATQLQQLIESDLIADLTDVYDKFATEDTKSFMTADGGKELGTAKFNGKLMAIPVTDSPYNAAQFLYMRKDWLTKLNLPEPKTMQDVLKISEAFTTQDPDGNKKADSFGFVVQKEIYNPAYGFAGLFNGYHAYPGAWVKDASGKLAYGSIQPEMKTALKTLQDLYKSGQIDKEFFTKDHAKVNELVANNQGGIAYGPFWLTSWPMPSAVVKDNKVTEDWEVYQIPSADDKPALTQVGMNVGNVVVGQGVNGYYVVAKNSKHPEAAIKLLNKFIQVDTVPPTEETDKFHFGKDKKELWKLNPIVVSSQNLNVKTGAILAKAIEAKDPSTLKDNVSGTAYYNDAIAYLGGDTSHWSSYMNAKTHGSLEIMSQYLQDDRYIYDEFSGSPTPAMIAKKPILDQKELELYTNIITNQVSIDEFDKFIEQWKSLGGTEITNEVNDWYAKNAGK
jgi:putative aldouronate transport system substrate-binding protein